MNGMIAFLEDIQLRPGAPVGGGVRLYVEMEMVHVVGGAGGKRKQQQAVANPIKMKILSEACVWPGPHSRCIVSV